jgi:hypothetical protein
VSVEVTALRGGSAGPYEVRLVLNGTYFFRRLHTVKTFSTKWGEELKTFEPGTKAILRVVTNEGVTLFTEDDRAFTVRLEGIESILQELPVRAGPSRSAWEWLNSQEEGE